MQDTSNAPGTSRADRFSALVKELMPKIRSLSPHLTDAELRAAAERMAQYRLDDGYTGGTEA